MGTQNPRFFPLMGTVPSTKYCWAPGSFDLMGTVPSTKNAWAPKTPGFFPLMGTVPSTKYCLAPGSCPSVKILSKSVRHGSLGEATRSHKNCNNQPKYRNNRETLICKVKMLILLLLLLCCSKSRLFFAIVLEQQRPQKA